MCAWLLTLQQLKGQSFFAPTNIVLVVIAAVVVVIVVVVFVKNS